MSTRFKLRAPTDKVYAWLLKEVLIDIHVFAQNPGRRIISIATLPSDKEAQIKASGTIVTFDTLYEND